GGGGRAGGARRRVAGRDAGQPGALSAVGAAPGGELDRGAGQAPARGHGGAALAVESPAARRRRGRHARSPESRPVRLRHRPERRPARLRRARRAVRGEPGALLRGARHHPEGLEGRALQPPGSVLSIHRHDGDATAVPRAASAGADGRDDRGDVSQRRPDGAADLRRFAGHGGPRAGRMREKVSRGLARGRSPRRRRRVPPDPGIRRADRESGDRRAPGHDHVLLPTSGRPHARAARPPRNRPGGAQDQSVPDALEPLLSGDPRNEGGLRLRSRAGGAIQAAPRGAELERRGRRAESGRAPANGAREADLADSHAPGDARVQVATGRSQGATMTATPKFETVRYEPKGPICHIVLNRPEKLNAANDQLVEEVNDALFEFDADPTLQVAILSGAGRAFCSGADVRQRQLRTREELKRLGGPAGRRSRENGLGDTVNWKPVIAAVHGWALGLGYSLSQSCDLVVAAEGA